MANNEQDKLMKDAQYRKGLSIAFFNANNVAAQMVEIESKMQPQLAESVTKRVVKKGTKPAAVKKLAAKLKPLVLTDRITFYRDWLLKEHAEYYARVIAPVGAVNFKPESAIKALKATKTKGELLTAWNLLSEDERHHDEILKVAREERVKYNDDQTPPPEHNEPEVQAPK